jgi:hypothetical protein
MRAITAYGKVRYQLKSPYRDGTTHVIFELLDFIARLAVLMPKPIVNISSDKNDWRHHRLVRRRVDLDSRLSDTDLLLKG